jgi:hypothetical protein
MARTRARGRAARLTILNAAFGAGAVLGPVCANVLGSRTLVLGFAVAAVLACAMAASLIGISVTAPAADPRPPRPDRADGQDERGQRDGRDRGRARARGRPGVATAALGYLFYVGCEAGTAGLPDADRAITG